MFNIDNLSFWDIHNSSKFYSFVLEYFSNINVSFLIIFYICILQRQAHMYTKTLKDMLA